jgi:predicted TIM-barrel fold metal-dependent hydrolase
LGDPYFDETINIASRFPNTYLILPIWFQRYFIQPLEMLHVLGKALLWVGEDRLCYGTDAFLWPNLQTYVDLWAGLEMPETLQNQYGYPAISAEVKRKVFGANFAEGLGMDMDAEAGILRRRETRQRLSGAVST